VLCLLSLLLLVQGQNAEETFKKIEDQIVTAKTLEVKFTLGSGAAGDVDGEKAVRMSGTLLLKDGNKGLLTHRTTPFPIDTTRLSDGKRIRTAGLKFETDTPENFKEGTLLGLARAGMMPTMFLAFQMLDIGEQEKSFQAFVKTLRIEKIQQGEDDGAVKTLTYAVRVADAYQPNKAETLEARLWYDPKTFKILKRTMTSGGKVLLETYEGWVFNAELPDEKFTLPK